MTPEGRALRDALATATSGNGPLTTAIQATGPLQAEMAMTKAWQLKAPKRTWRQREDVVPLLEPCKVFPELGAKASGLLAQAPLREIGPGIIPELYAQTWARPILEQWEQSADLPSQVKRAIQQQGKKGG
jgi:hypothetical protein